MAITNMKIEVQPVPVPVNDNLTKNMGGRDSDGNYYGVNSRYLTKNSKPILPVMGEFHYSRYSPLEWEEAILKMRAGGVDILATYVFWIHHEEKKGEWDFTGCRDIRKFLETCKNVNMPVWLRIGPWVHGECRNGGFPDWLVGELGSTAFGVNPEKRAEFEAQGKAVHEVRTNDEVYIGYVRKFWARLSKEVTGMMCRDGGPVIGIQLENEYGHVGGASDRDEGMAHMEALWRLASELGFQTPYYTATGWGGAIVLEGKTLPVLGGYVDAPWANHTEEMPASENFLIWPFAGEEGGDSKTKPNERRLMFSVTENPCLTAELGGGLQVTSHRRTYPFANDIEAQSFCMLAAGANLLGYYMYHGGFNPEGKYSTMQESAASGYSNDLPIRGYDFEACIHESGRLNGSYFRLKKLHLMVHSFAQHLAPAVAYFPDVRPKDAEDMVTPRISVRYNHVTKEGFLFLNNHQRLRKMNPVCGLDVEIAGILENPGEIFTVRDINCADGECMVIPFNLMLGESRLLRTNASLLAKAGERYFFYYDGAGNKNPYFEYEGEPYKKVVVLTKKEAESAYIFGDALYLSDRPMFQQQNRLYMLKGEQEEMYRFYDGPGGLAQRYALPPQKVTHVSCAYGECDEAGKTEALVTADKYNDMPAPSGCTAYDIEIEVSKTVSNIAPFDNGAADELNEVYLHIDFAGDKAQLYEGDKLLTDWFANGTEWVVALKRYGYPKHLKLVAYPFREHVYYDLEPKRGCGILGLSCEAEYKIAVI